MSKSVYKQKLIITFSDIFGSRGGATLTSENVNNVTNLHATLNKDWHHIPLLRRNVFLIPIIFCQLKHKMKTMMIRVLSFLVLFLNVY